GFLGARLVPPFPGNGGWRGMSAIDLGGARVRYVEPSADGGVHIVLDEVRERTVSGRLDDRNIRALLMAATRDSADPGLRLATVDLLNSRAQQVDVRDALLQALRH